MLSHGVAKSQTLLQPNPKTNVWSWKPDPEASGSHTLSCKVRNGAPCPCRQSLPPDHSDFPASPIISRLLLDGGSSPCVHRGSCRTDCGIPQVQEGLRSRSGVGPKLATQSTEQSSPVRAKQETGRGKMDLILNPAQTRKTAKLQAKMQGAHLAWS